MATYYSCPNCGRTISKDLLHGSYFAIYECRKCHKLYCHDSAKSNCSKYPGCGSDVWFEKGTMKER